MESIDRYGVVLLCEAALAKIKAVDAALADVVVKLIDFDKPAESALALMNTAITNATRDWPAEVCDIARALIQYQMRLSYLDGRDDEANRVEDAPVTVHGEPVE